MKYVAICFTDEKYTKTKERYTTELKSKNIFDEVIPYGPTDIDPDFYNTHKSFIANNPKGYGYYIWKPYFILKTLLTLSNGDVLVYGDSGNDMPGTRDECLGIFNKVIDVNKGIKIIACKQGWNIRWIKSDLYWKMGWKTFLFAFRFMPEAARIVFKKNDETIAFVKEWLYYATEDYHNIDDSPSRFPNLPFFLAHRYDQSIFSILFHRYKGTRVEFGDIWRAKRLRF